MMKWAGHVARMAESGMYTELWSGNLKRRDHLADLDLHEGVDWINSIRLADIRTSDGLF
jgi:hypothetical protein